MSLGRRFRAWVCLLGVGVVAAAWAPSALADGDPASDFLPTFDSFLPLSPVAPAKPTANALNRLLKDARDREHPFKVAVIATPTDLGAVTVLFGKPQQYAKFLSREIQPFLAGGTTLLIAMQKGFGLIGGDANAAGRAAAQTVHVPANASPTALTQAAIDAVQAVARANGQALPHVSAVAARSAGSGGTSHTTRWVLIGAAVALLVAGGLIAWGMRAGRATTPVDT